MEIKESPTVNTSKTKTEVVNGITRRQFLWGAGTTVALIAAGVSLTESGRKREKELERLSSKIVMIDFAPERRIGGIKQEQFPNNQEIIKAILGGEYKSRIQLIKEFGLDALDRDTLEKKVFSKYPKLASVYGFMERFAKHGKEVASVMKFILAKNGFESEPYIIPIQEMLGNYEFTRDELGNFGLFGEVDPEGVIEALGDYPGQKIVNLSFQIGEVGFVYREKSEILKPGQKFPATTRMKDENGEMKTYILAEGQPIPVTEEELEKMNEVIFVVEKHEPFFDIMGAYSRQMAKENLPKLFKICHAFPDKLFVAAAGNYDDNFIEERTILQDQWPPNVIMVAEWDKERPRSDVEGADVYIDNQALGIGHGSSFSTPAITAVALALENQGLKPAEIKGKIFSFCEMRTYKGYDPEIRAMVSRQARLFKLNNFQQHLEKGR